MKSEVLIYKIISFLLLPVAVLFALSALFGLLSVFANPSAIVGVLITGAVAFYIVCCFSFLTSAVSGGKQLTSSLRKRIQISALITVVFCVMILCIHLIIISNAEVVSLLVKEMMKQPGLPNNVTTALLAQSIRSGFTFFMIISLVLLLHIIMSFRLLKQYSDTGNAKLDIEG